MLPKNKRMKKGNCKEKKLLESSCVLTPQIVLALIAFNEASGAHEDAINDAK